MIVGVGDPAWAGQADPDSIEAQEVRMRIKVGLLILTAFVFCAICGCAGIGKIPKAEDVLDVGPLANILVFVSDVPLGESGKSAEATEINVGGTIYFTAQGRDGNNKPIKISPKWTPSKPDLVEINPGTGPAVAVKGLRPGSLEIVVEFSGVKKTLQYIFVK